MNTSQPSPQQLLEKVWHFIRQKDARQAVASSNLLVRKFPDFAAGWHAASHVAQLVGQPEAALEAIDRALRPDPGNIDWQMHRVGCLLMCGNSERGRESLLDLVRGSQPFGPAQLSPLAFLCTRLDLHEDAERIYRRLIEMEPANGGHWYNLASVQRFRGQIAEAEASLDRAIELNREDYDAWELRSDLRRQSRASNHVEELRALLEGGIKVPAGEVRVCHALAKELEDIGEPRQSFEALARGAALRRKHIDYDINDDLQTIEAIMASFTRERLASGAGGHVTDEPIFIVGLPRTGSTLLERILGSHSRVTAAGELNNFAVQMMAQVRKTPGAPIRSREQLVQRSAELDFAALGRAYLDSTRPATGSTPHFIDKMPLNFLYAGLIRLSLPGARIIHLERHPMDTCYAIYKRLFRDGYPWSYDLDEIAAYYLAYRRLMQHWREAMPGRIFELSYEDLVNDIETSLRGVLDFCGLEWEAQCLEFDRSTAATTTASAAQVRQPLYTSSVQRWRDYQRELAPLAERLRENGVRID